MFRKLLCYIGWHSWYCEEMPSEHIELHEIAIFKKCKHCGTYWRLL